jgi:hydroxypyruvate reductase
VAAVAAHFRTDGEWLIAGKKRYRLRSYENIWVIGAGKASAAMAQAVERVLGSRVGGGVVSVKYGHVAKLRRVDLVECGHPVPDLAGVEGAARIADVARQAGANDLVICVISGGASALMPAPAPPITLEEKQATTRMLLNCGANIAELNAIRKHISLLKGGQLARLASPASVVSLMLSDVIGDDLDVIGSGPTAPDSSTFQQARAILVKYGLETKVPRPVAERIDAGIRGEIPETPKPGDAAFAHTQNLVVGSCQLAVDAAAAKARSLGYRTLLLSTFVEGETREVARVHGAIGKELRAFGRPVKLPACIISGGETTVTIRGDGKGGRNQEFVLAAARDLAGLRGVVILSGGTDGTDGPTDAAGAIADGSTVSRGEAIGLNAGEYLARNDSYNYFDKLGDLLKTGPTNTNVMDVRVLLVGS